MFLLMTYERIIIKILIEAGERGLPVYKIARHVHHEVNSLFERVDYEDVYNAVRKYIHKNSRNSNSPFEHAPDYGRYRVNRNSEKFMQLQLKFETEY